MTMMQKIFVALLVCALLVACAPASSSASVPASSTESVPAPSSRTSESAPPAPLPPADAARVEVPAACWEDLTDAPGLRYADPLSPKYPERIRTPGFVGYEGDTLYFVSDEESPFVGREPTAQFADICEKLYAYDLLTGEKRAVGARVTSRYSMPCDLLCAGAHYYPSWGWEDGALSVHRLDLASGVSQTVLTEPDGTYQNSAGKTADGRPVFLIGTGEAGEVTGQKLFLLDGETPRLLYEGAPDFTALSAQGDSLWLLKQTRADGALRTEAVETDTAGEVLRTLSLPGTQRDAQSNARADRLYVCGDRLFLKWSGAAEELPHFMAYRLAGGRAEPLAVPENEPCFLLTPEPVGGQYLLFSASPDGGDDATPRFTSHFYLFDLETDTFTGLHLDLPQDAAVQQTVCNERGDLLLEVWEENAVRILKLDFDRLPIP